MGDFATVPAGRNRWLDPKGVAATPGSSPSPVTNVFGASSAVRVTDRSYSGLYSYLITTDGAMKWQAAANDHATYLDVVPGDVIYAAIRVAPVDSNGKIALQISYTDASGGETDYQNLVTSEQFTTLRFELPIAAGKTLRSVQFLLHSNASTSYYVGGAEWRRNQPIDTFIHGDAGEGYSWEGTANASASNREAFVATPVFGSGGQYTPTLTVEVVSRQGQLLRDITEHVLDGSITYDLEADANKGSCTLTFDEPGLVEVLGDEWAKVSLRIDRPDGSVEEGPLGVFILDPPKERWSEGQDEWVYPGRDIISLLDTTFIRGVPELVVFGTDEETTLLSSYAVVEGTSYRAVLEDVLLNDVGLARSQFSFSGALPQSFDADTAWEPVASALDIVRGTLEGAGWMGPWATTGGVVTSAPAGVNPATVSPAIVLSTGNNSRLRWPFEVDPDAGGIGNRVRVISAKDVTSSTTSRKKRKGKKARNITNKKTERHAVEVWRMNNDPSHPLSFPRLGRWLDLPDVEQPLVQNDAEAAALADQALIEGGQLPIRVRLTTEAMVRGLNEVYELDLKDAYGEPIASGQGRYWCKGWSIQLGPPWEMVHSLSRTIDFRAASFVSG